MTIGIRKLVAFVMIASMVLAGCQNTLVSEDPSTLSVAEREIRDNQVSRQKTAVAVGAVLGAATAIGIARNNARKQGRTLSAQEEVLAGLAGAAGGAALGKVTGDYVNSRSQNYASAQQELRSYIAATDRDIANYQRLNSSSARLISQQQTKIRNLNSRLRSGAISADGYRTQIASARNNVRVLDSGVADITKQINFMKKDIGDLQRSGKSTRGLSSRISSLESQKRALESRRRQLISVYTDVPSSVGSFDF